MGCYVPSTPAQRQEMLEAIGLHDFRQLYRDVPEEMLLRDGLDLPEGMSELEGSRTMTAMAARNTAYSAVLRGAGAYDHYIPSLVKYVPAKEEFLTAYTPYQAEISQGVLQGTFEFQTMICELTGMDVANADLRCGPPGHHQHRPHLLLRHRRRAACRPREGRPHGPGSPASDVGRGRRLRRVHPAAQLLRSAGGG